MDLPLQNPFQAVLINIHLLYIVFHVWIENLVTIFSIITNHF